MKSMTGTSGDILKGLKDSSTKPPSGGMKGGSVDSGTERSKTAPTPKTLGGRDA